MRRFPLALFVLFSFSILFNGVPATTQSQNVDPKLILQKAMDACLKVKNIEYVEEQVAEGNDNSPFLTATIRQSRAAVPSAGFLPGLFVVSGTLKEAGVAQREFAYSYDGNSLRLLDPAEKTVRVAKSPSPRIAGSLLASLGLIGIPQFTQEQPFKPFLEKSVSLLYEGTTSIKDTPCHIVSVTQAINDPSRGKTNITTRWFIGAEDGLPRGNQLGKTRKLIRILKVNAANPQAEYALATPNGYSEKLITGSESETNGLLAVGSVAPDWSLQDSAGHTRSLKDYRGKVVLMDFWGTWCVPCRKTMPGIQKLHEKFKDRGLVVFGIAVADNEGDPIGYMKRKGFSYNLLLKGDDVAALYKTEVLPTLYIIGPDGKIIHAEYGYRENAGNELASIIERHLSSLQ